MLFNIIFVNYLGTTESLDLRQSDQETNKANEALNLSSDSSQSCSNFPVQTTQSETDTSNSSSGISTSRKNLSRSSDSSKNSYQDDKITTSHQHQISQHETSGSCDDKAKNHHNKSRPTIRSVARVRFDLDNYKNIK